MTFDYDGATGRLTAKQTISSLPPGFAGTNFTSEVAISPDARFVYAANRLHDTIAWFAIAADGTLRFTGEEPTRGDYPRFFTFDPSGGFVYSCNQRADAIVSFRVNRETGALTHPANTLLLARRLSWLFSYSGTLDDCDDHGESEIITRRDAASVAARRNETMGSGVRSLARFSVLIQEHGDGPMQTRGLGVDFGHFTVQAPATLCSK